MDAFKLNCAKKLCAMLVCVLPFIHWIQNNFHVQTMLNINKKYHIIHNNTYIKTHRAELIFLGKCHCSIERYRQENNKQMA